MVTLALDIDQKIDRLKRLRDSVSAEALDPVIEREAQITLSRLIQATPVRWSISGARQSWRIDRIGPSAYRVFNDNRVMYWLENGTGKDTGGYIYPKVKKALFVPLTKKAALANRNGFTKAKVRRLVARDLKNRKAIYGSFRGIRLPKAARSASTLVYGIDYVLAKRVRGIKPMRIAATETVLVRQRLVAGIVRWINEQIRKG